MALKIDVTRYNGKSVYTKIYSPERSFCDVISFPTHAQVTIHPDTVMNVFFLKNGEGVTDELARIRAQSKNFTLAIYPASHEGFEIRAWGEGMEHGGVTVTNKGGIQYIHEPQEDGGGLLDFIGKNIPE